MLTARSVADGALRDGMIRLWADLHPAAAAFITAFEDGGTPLLLVNDALRTLVGHPPPARSTPRGAGAGILHPDDRAAFDGYLDRIRALATADAPAVRYRLGHADGTMRWFVSSPVRAQRADDGRVQAVLSVAIPAAPAVQDDTDRETTNRFAAAIDGSPVMVSAQDRELRYTWVRNPPSPLQVSTMLGGTDRLLLPRAADADRVEAIKRAVLETGVAQRQEVDVHLGGTDRCYDLSVGPQRDATGAVTGLVCTAVDVTGRLHTDADLAFLAELSDGLAAAGTASDVVGVAAAVVARHFGLSRCLLLEVDDADEQATILVDHRASGAARSGAMRLSDLFEPGERARLTTGETVERVLPTAADRDAAGAGESGPRLRVLVPSLDRGRVRLVLSAERPLIHGWRRKRARLLRDVPARVRLRLECIRFEDRLRAARDTFRHLVERSPFGVYVVDAEFRLVQVSAGARPTFRGVEPLLGRDFADVLRQIWPEPFASEAIAVFRHTLATGEEYHAPSTVERRRDRGEVEAYDWKTERLVLPDGRHGVVCHFYDLSERQRLIDALQEAARVKDAFVAMLAHELRNPLAPIRTAVSVLRMESGASAGVARCVDVIDRQVAQMSRLLDDLLDVSRLAMGRLELRPVVVDLVDVIAAAVETSRPLVDRYGQYLDLTVPDGGLRVVGDGARLVQVIANLLDNAAKFSPRGGRISLEAYGRDADVVVRVRDTGIGIAAERLARVFELYDQGSTEGHRPSSGLGIGLSLARRLVELHGGTITAASAGPGLGSEFTIALPAGAGSARSGRTGAT